MRIASPVPVWRWIPVFTSVYALGMTLWVLGQWIASHGEANAPGWALLLPLQAAAAFAVLHRLHHSKLGRARRLGWILLTVAFLVDMLAIVDWNVLFRTDPAPLGTFADLLYFANYALLTGACAAFFVSCRGRFSSSRTWLDAATLVLGATAGLIPFFIAPIFDEDRIVSGSVPAAFSYGIGIVATGTMASLLFMQWMDWKRDRAMIAVVVAIAVFLTTDVGSIAANLRGHFLLGNLDDLGNGWAYVCFVVAALLERDAEVESTRVPGGNVYSFVPVFAILVSLSLLLGAETLPSGGSRWIAAIVVLGGAALLLVRQLGVRHELASLSAALAGREAEARLSELVHASADTFIVVGDDGYVTYASPNALELLGRGPESWVGRPARILLGLQNEQSVAALLVEARASQGDLTLYEASVASAHPMPRTIQVVARSANDNPLIRGLVLTLRDISEQRSAERALLELAARERRDLAQQVHEDLGQELVGIAFTLQGIANSTPEQSSPVRIGLTEATAALQGVTGKLRQLASDLSPLGVASDSLAGALRALAAEVQRHHPVTIDIHADDAAWNAVTANDHVYFIARAAIERAAGQAGCRRIEVRVSVRSGQLQLAILDDATAGASAPASPESWAVRMMRHRARLVNGVLAIDAAAERGNRVVLYAPAQRPQVPVADH